MARPLQPQPPRRRPRRPRRALPRPPRRPQPRACLPCCQARLCPLLRQAPQRRRPPRPPLPWQPRAPAGTHTRSQLVREYYEQGAGLRWLCALLGRVMLAVLTLQATSVPGPTPVSRGSHDELGAHPPLVLDTRGVAEQRVAARARHVAAGAGPGRPRGQELRAHRGRGRGRRRGRGAAAAAAEEALGRKPAGLGSPQRVLLVLRHAAGVRLRAGNRTLLRCLRTSVPSQLRKLETSRRNCVTTRLAPACLDRAAVEVAAAVHAGEARRGAAGHVGLHLGLRHTGGVSAQLASGIQQCCAASMSGQCQELGVCLPSSGTPHSHRTGTIPWYERALMRRAASGCTALCKLSRTAAPRAGLRVDSRESAAVKDAWESTSRSNSASAQAQSMAGKEFAAQVTWAQRKDRLYLTIDVQDCVEPKIDLTNVGEGDAEKHGRVSFRGEGRSHATGSEKHNYTLELELNKVLDTCLASERSRRACPACHFAPSKAAALTHFGRTTSPALHEPPLLVGAGAVVKGAESARFQGRQLAAHQMKSVDA